MIELPQLQCNYEISALEPVRKLTGVLDALPDTCRGCTMLGQFVSAAVAEVTTHIDSQHAVDHADELEAQSPIVALAMVDRFIENPADADVHVEVQRQPRVTVITTDTASMKYQSLRSLIAETDKDSALVAIEDLESKLAQCKRTNRC